MFKMKMMTMGMILAVSSTTFANDDQLDIDLTQITADEIAMLAVVVESCPQLIEVTPAYQNNIKKIVAAHLPDAKNPIAELQIRSQSDELRSLMVENRRLFNEVGEEANKSLCEDIRDYKE